MSLRPLLLALIVCAASPRTMRAHDGPPFPIVSDRRAGAYVVSVWTDPDATDDGAAGGQFWVQLQLAEARGELPETTRATLSVRPADGTATVQTARTEPVRGDVTNQFAAVVMGHEGRFAVEIAIDGPAGGATVRADVDATYDLRPPPAMLALYALPFVLAGMLWIRLLVKRRNAR
jgi:hypothetical protein